MSNGVDMVEVDGVLFRPEDAKRARKAAEGVADDTPEPVAMLDIDGVLYRPEDAKRLGLVPADDDEQDDEAPTRLDEVTDPIDPQEVADGIVPPADGEPVLTSTDAQQGAPDDDTDAGAGEPTDDAPARRAGKRPGR